MKYTKKYLFFFLFVSFGACQAPESVKKEGQVESKKAEPLPEPSLEKKADFVGWYSPFVVDISSKKMAFNTISFKDVSQGEADSEREAIMETLAESLGTSIGSDPIFKAEWELRYDKDITKPANHKACGQHHLYVDVWHQGENTQKAPLEWGYSLWSGCSADDEFASSSVLIPITSDPSAIVAPLVNDIHKKLSKAHNLKCFVKSC